MRRFRRSVEDSRQEPAEGVVLARSVGGPVPVGREHGLTDIVRGVVGEVVAVLGVPDVRQVGQRRLGLLQKGCAALLVDRDLLEAACRDEFVDGPLLCRGQWPHRHGRSPRTGTVGPCRT